MATAFGLFCLSFHHWSQQRDYCQTREAISAIGAAPNASYTIGGRTFTKANLSDLKKHLEPLAEYLPSFLAITARQPPPSSACASSHRACLRVPAASPAQGTSQSTSCISCNYHETYCTPRQLFAMPVKIAIATKSAIKTGHDSPPSSRFT